MERRLVVNQPGDHPSVKTAGVVKAAFFQKELAASARSIQHHPFNFVVQVALRSQVQDKLLHAPVENSNANDGGVAQRGGDHGSHEPSGGVGGIDEQGDPQAEEQPDLKG